MLLSMGPKGANPKNVTFFWLEQLTSQLRFRDYKPQRPQKCGHFGFMTYAAVSDTARIHKSAFTRGSVLTDGYRNCNRVSTRVETNQATQ
jgi:hypothetical protein